MNLTPREKDKLLVSLAAMVARNRLARGVKLNHPEAMLRLCDGTPVRVSRTHIDALLHALHAGR